MKKKHTSQQLVDLIDQYVIGTADPGMITASNVARYANDVLFVTPAITAQNITRDITAKAHINELNDRWANRNQPAIKSYVYTDPDVKRIVSQAKTPQDLEPILLELCGLARERSRNCELISAASKDLQAVEKQHSEELKKAREEIKACHATIRDLKNRVSELKKYCSDYVKDPLINSYLSNVLDTDNELPEHLKHMTLSVTDDIAEKISAYQSDMQENENNIEHDDIFSLINQEAKNHACKKQP